MDEHYRSLPLNPLRAFAIASRHKTFTSAANHMGVTQVAISRQISMLESYLGVQLFERSSRAVKLTEVGRELSLEIVYLFDDIETATNRVLTRERETTVSLRVYPTFAQHWLLPRLGRFIEIYPEYQVRFDTVVEPLDFRGTHLDVAIQLGSGDWKDTRSRQIFEEVVDAVCSPGYFEAHRQISEPLKNITLLQSKYRRREWETWLGAAGLNLSIKSIMEFDSSILTYGAAERNLGVTIGQLNLLENEIRQGTLIRPYNRSMKTGSGFHVVWPKTKSVSIQTKRFIDWILEEAGEKTEFFRR